MVGACFHMSSNFGNDKITSLDFDILVNLFAVIRSLILTSLIKLLTALAADFAAYDISRPIWLDTQFIWPAALRSSWVSWSSSLKSFWLGVSTLTYLISAIYPFWWIRISVFFWTIFELRYLNARVSSLLMTNFFLIWLIIFLWNH